MPDLVGNPEDRFSRNAGVGVRFIIFIVNSSTSYSKETCKIVNKFLPMRKQNNLRQLMF